MTPPQRIAKHLQHRSLMVPDIPRNQQAGHSGTNGVARSCAFGGDDGQAGGCGFQHGVGNPRASWQHHQVHGPIVRRSVGHKTGAMDAGVAFNADARPGPERIFGGIDQPTSSKCASGSCFRIVSKASTSSGNAFVARQAANKSTTLAWPECSAVRMSLDPARSVPRRRRCCCRCPATAFCRGQCQRDRLRPHAFAVAKHHVRQARGGALRSQ